jgi:aerotaxis receptor
MRVEKWRLAARLNNGKKYCQLMRNSNVRNTGPVTQRERFFKEQNQLISTTTPKGVITYANAEFCDISGYSLDELVGEAHNLIRHPDMPAQAFERMWTVLKQGLPWMGVVKNRCKNGDHYWVDAFVSPIFEHGQIAGFQSVRKKPAADVTRMAEQVYAGVNGKSSFWAQLRGKLLPSIMGQFWFCGVAGVGTAAMTAWLGAPLIGAAAGGVIASWLVAWLLAQPYRLAAQQAAGIYDDAIAQQVYTGRSDELGKLLLVQHFLDMQANTVTRRMADAAQRLQGITDIANDACRSNHDAIEQQKHEVAQISLSLTQMGGAVEEVNRSTHHTTQATLDAQTKAQAGKLQVQETARSIHELAEEVTQAAGVIGELQNDCESISSVVDVIRGIAEQTNLLALNAAIEAARAGDQGRGFAVVADEVRKLAQQTAESTRRIQTMIEQLQNIANKAVQTMQRGTGQASQCVEQINETGASLDTISESVRSINDMSLQISAAMEQQAATAREIQSNVTRLTQHADDTAQGARRTLEANQQVGTQANDLREVVAQFSRR